MKKNNLINEMKKFNRQVPSKELENKIRHDIQTEFILDEKPAAGFKEFVMKKIFLIGSSAAVVTALALIVFSIFPLGTKQNEIKDDYISIPIVKEKKKNIKNVKLNKKPAQTVAKAKMRATDNLNQQFDENETLFGKAPAKQKNVYNYSKITKTEAMAQRQKFKNTAACCLAESREVTQVIPPYPRPCPRPKPGGKFNTEDYDRIYENDFKLALDSPLSTFSIDVDSASYANLRRYLNSNKMPPKDAVRIEEMINYFTYNYPQPKVDKPFSITTEIAECPWNKENNLVMIGLQAKKIKIDKLPPNNLVFLIDVSGSMNSSKKLPLLKSAFKLLTKQLRSEDRVSIVVYAGAAGLVLDSTPGDRKEKILAAIEKLNAGGSTAGGAGVKLAYKIAKENFISNGNNRVILATDGDFNIGQSSDSALVRMIEERRNDGIFLTILGFGMGNYKDNKMEKLADKGNGNYAYIDDIMEAKKVLVNELGATLFTIAKDVKLQIEFNPAKIKAYRLIGYENRVLAKEDFNDDKKDAGELGAGHSVTAFYEIVPASSTQTFAKVDNLKYQKTKIKKSHELLTVKLRYKKPNENKSKLIEKNVMKRDIKKRPTTDFRFASAVAEFGMLLRDSKYKGAASYKSILHRARRSKGKDYEGYRAEFIRLVERAELIEQQKR